MANVTAGYDFKGAQSRPSKTSAFLVRPLCECELPVNLQSNLLAAKQGSMEQPTEPVVDTGRMALAHEWLAERAGSEILFEEIASAFPEADLFALTVSPSASFDFGNRRVLATSLNAFEFTRRRRDVTLPLMPLAWKSFRRDNYEVVLTSTHAFGREFVRRGDGIHLNYVHAPMRYAWSPELDGRAFDRGTLGRYATRILRTADLRSIDRVDAFAANSTAVAERIANYYGRQAEIIFPPVDTDYFGKVESRDDGYLLSASRFIPYKRHDLAIEAAALLDLPIVVAGSGPEEARLRALAKRAHPGGVEFVIQPDRATLRNLMAGASAFVFPAHEDFGIIVPEVQATGTPVVALRAGGTLDTVLDRGSGVLAAEQQPHAFAAAIADCINLKISPEKCRAQAEKFSRQRFSRELVEWVRSCVAGSQMDLGLRG